MRAFTYRFLVCLTLFTGTLQPLQAQETPADTLHKYETPAGAPKKPWYKGKLVRAAFVPALLTGYGISTIYDNGFYSSYEANRDIHKIFPNLRTPADDFLIFAPYLELAGLELLGIKSRSDRINTWLIILKSEAIMLSSVYALKHLTRIQRPDQSNYESFPSGHTAQAFLAASILHTELRDESQWYGVGAYAIATSVGVLRMVNTKHWQSDVFAGAGIGILSAHVGYLTHRNRWGRKPRERGLSLVPAFGLGYAGVWLTWQPGIQVPSSLQP